MIQRSPSPMLLVLSCIGVVQGQMPFRPKFFAGEDSPFLEAQRDALNLHEGDDASVSLAAPIAINCTVRGTDFVATLLQKGACSHPISMRGFMKLRAAVCGMHVHVSLLSRQVRSRCSATQGARTKTRQAASGRCTAVRPAPSEWTRACARRLSSRASSAVTAAR